MKRAIFTKENRQATRDRLKRQTRRIGDNPWKVEVGDMLALAEPVRIQELQIGDWMDFAKIVYLDSSTDKTVALTPESVNKIQRRKNPYRPTIARHMLDDFARHYIRITDKRVEQLQSISEEDAIAEGVPPFDWDDGNSDRPIAAFAKLWDSINDRPWRCWDDNPEVTAYSYEFYESLGELNS